LSGGERAYYLSLPNESRKNEWLAGRLSAKYLFLNRLETSQVIDGRQWRPTLAKLSWEDLDLYSSWMYQKVEVLRNGGMPRLVWCGQVRRESISLSHAGNVSCASIGLGTATAIDIETTDRRNDAFYANNFTQAERDWATRGWNGKPVNSNWTFTLLWTLKESALKSGWLNRASLWNLPRIEIDALPGVDRLEPFWFSNQVDNDFVVFTARVTAPSRVMRAQVAVTGTRNLVLTVMNLMIGATN
jgi:hypothetical protein